MSPLSAGFLHVGVTELLELLDEAVTVITLDLDDTVLHGAARATLLLELAADLFQRGARKRNSVDGAHAPAAAMRRLLPDADGRRLVSHARLHDLPPATCDAS